MLFWVMLPFANFERHFLIWPILSFLFSTRPSGPRIAYCYFVFYKLQCKSKLLLFGNFTLEDEEASTASTSKETIPVLISCLDPEQLQQSTRISFIA